MTLSGDGLERGTLAVDTRLPDAFARLRGETSGPLEFPKPDLADDAGLVEDIALVAEDDTPVRLEKRVRVLEERLAALEVATRPTKTIVGALRSVRCRAWHPGDSSAGEGFCVRLRRYLTQARSLLAPRTRFLPGLGARLDAHPRLAAAILVGLRSLPGRRLRRAAYINVSRPLVDRMTAQLQTPVSGGLRVIADTSDFVGSTLAAAGMWEPHVTRPFQRLLSPGDVIVDVGAHIGYYTLLASKLVGPEGHVYALEPTPTTFERLCANLALNNVANVTALCVAAGAEEGCALLGEAPPRHSARASIRDLSGADGARGHGDAATMSVHVRPVASLVPQSEWEKVRLVKIDVEGYEADVLLGLEALFEVGTGPALLVEVHADAVDEVAAYLVKLTVTYGLTALELVEEEPFERAAPAGPPREVSALLASGLGDRPTMNLLVTAGDAVRDAPGTSNGRLGSLAWL